MKFLTKVRERLFDLTLATLIAIMIGSLVLFLGTSVGAAETPEPPEPPVPPTIEIPAAPTASPAVSGENKTAVSPATAQVRPVSRRVEMLDVPTVKSGWVWTSDPLTDKDALALAELYADYKGPLAPVEAKTFRHMLLLVATGPGRGDQDLKTLLYSAAYANNEQHPLREVLERTGRISIVQYPVDSKEAEEFRRRMSATAIRYGL